MNLFKGSFFSSSRRAQKVSENQNQLKNYKFRQATTSSEDPLLYTFELESLPSDDESTTEQQLRPRQLKKPIVDNGGSIIIVEKSILPNESIQAFAIRYRVPVSQLKRINNLQNDQDFYALSHCRVPVRRFGILHESSILIDLDETTSRSVPVTHLSQQNHHAFLNAMDQDLATMRTKIEQFIDQPSASASLLAEQSSPIETLKSSTNSSNDWCCDTADWTCKPWQIIVILILIALIPFLYIYFYLKTRHSNR